MESIANAIQRTLCNLGTPGGPGYGEGERNSSVQCNVECELKRLRLAISPTERAEKSKANGGVFEGSSDI